MLDTLDSVVWSLGAVCSAFMQFKNAEVASPVMILFVLSIAWVNTFISHRPPFRQNAGAGIVSGVIGIPAAMASSGSAFLAVSMANSFNFCLLFLLTRRLIPTKDLRFSIAVPFLSSFLVSHFYSISFLQIIIPCAFSELVLTSLMAFAPGSFSIGECMIVSSLSAFPVFSLFNTTGIQAVAAAFVAGAVLCLSLSISLKIPIAVMSAILPMYYAVKYFKELMSFIFDPLRVGLLLYCGVICVIFVVASMKWKGLAKFPQIVQRKFFHIMALLVFVPPEIIDPDWLRLSICGAIYIFLVIESLRIVRFPFIASIIESYVSGFIDERDSAELILTHLFLLLGCGLPVLVCRKPGFAGSTIRLGGISVLAIGDATASAVGTKWGRHKWPGSKKSLEGSLGAFIGTWICLIILTFFDGLSTNLLKMAALAIPSMAGALDEAFTSQIDNLTLPLVLMPFIFIASIFVQ